MASCLSYPIPNPSRPGERLKAAPWHLLAISLKSLSPPRHGEKANKLWVGCLCSLKLTKDNRIRERSADNLSEDRFEEKKTKYISFFLHSCVFCMPYRGRISSLTDSRFKLNKIKIKNKK